MEIVFVLFVCFVHGFSAARMWLAASDTTDPLHKVIALLIATTHYVSEACY